MNLNLNDDQLRTILAGAVLQAITPENRDKLISEAVASLMMPQDRYETLEQVNQWTPPTPDHQNFKAFMVDQLTKSIEWELGGNYYQDFIAKLKSQDAATLVSEHVARLHKSVARNIEEHAKEVERVAGRNKWNRDLRESLK